jgi:hypothetical protein
LALAALDGERKEGDVKADIRILTFVHCFSRYIQSQIRIADRHPLSGQKFNPSAQTSTANGCSGFINTLSIAGEENCRCALGIAPNKTELRIFEPGKAPKLDRVINGEIP